MQNLISGFVFFFTNEEYTAAQLQFNHHYTIFKCPWEDASYKWFSKKWINFEVYNNHEMDAY